MECTKQMDESSKITIDEINETVQECLVTIDELNQQGRSVAAFNLDFVPTKNAEPIYFMSADLIYQDMKLLCFLKNTSMK